MHEEIPWLTRAYFVSYAAGQVLPTSVGGDAVRIFETARRHPGHGNTAAATVLLERAIGGAATLLLAAVGFLLAVGHYDVGAYLWIEAFFVVATVVFGFLLFSQRARPLLRLGRPAARGRPPRPARQPGLPRDALVPRPRGPPVRRLPRHARRAGGPRAGDLAQRRGGGDRPLAPPVLRDGPAPLPRDARPVHAQRARRPRGVLRQLPRERRRRRRQRLCGRLPLLRRHRPDGAPGRSDPRLGGHPRAARGVRQADA